MCFEDNSGRRFCDFSIATSARRFPQRHKKRRVIFSYILFYFQKLSTTNFSHDLVHKNRCKNNRIIHAIFNLK